MTKPAVGLRVAVASGNYLLRHGVAQLLDDSEQFAVVAESPIGKELDQLLANAKPDIVVLLDAPEPPLGTLLQHARHIQQARSAKVVVMLSGKARLTAAAESLRPGRPGAVLRYERIEQVTHLLAVLTSVACGHRVLDAAISLAPDAIADSRRVLPELTDREYEVLRLMAQGSSNADIARRLVVTKKAVEGHVNAIFHRLGLADAEQDSRDRRVSAVLRFLDAHAGAGDPSAASAASHARTRYRSRNPLGYTPQ